MTTRSARRPWASVARMLARFVSAASATGAPASPRRSARSRAPARRPPRPRSRAHAGRCGRARRAATAASTSRCRLAADQQRRPGHDAAAVTRSSSAMPWRSAAARGCARASRARPRGRPWRGPSRRRRGIHLLGNRVPIPAGGALARPARAESAAALAHERGLLGLGHAPVPLAARAAPAGFQLDRYPMTANARPDRHATGYSHPSTPVRDCASRACEDLHASIGARAPCSGERLQVAID